MYWTSHLSSSLLHLKAAVADAALSLYRALESVCPFLVPSLRRAEIENVKTKTTTGRDAAPAPALYQERDR